MVISIFAGILVGYNLALFKEAKVDYKVELNKDGSVTIKSAHRASTIESLDRLEDYIELDNI